MNSTRPKHFCSRAELFTWLLYKCKDLSGRNLFEVKVVSAVKRCFFLLLLTHFTKAHSERCAWMAVIQSSFTWFAWKCVLFSPLWWLYLVSTNSWCRLSADSDSFVGIMLTRQRAINNSAFSAASPICGGCHGGSHSSARWRHFNVWLGPFFIISFCLTLNQVDTKHS